VVCSALRANYSLGLTGIILYVLKLFQILKRVERVYDSYPCRMISPFTTEEATTNIYGRQDSRALAVYFSLYPEVMMHVWSDSLVYLANHLYAIDQRTLTLAEEPQ
jgi:hypothetical protein